MKKLRIVLGLALALLLIAGPVFAADQTIASTEEMVGSGHATKTDTLNRLTLVEHETTGAHKAVITGLSVTAGKTITATQNTTLDEAVAMSSKAPIASPVFTGDVTLSGKAVNTTLPAFLTQLAAARSDVTGDGTAYTVVWGSEIFDQAANFDNASTFTAPVTGKYPFNVRLGTTGILVTHTTIYIVLVTSNRSYNLFYSEGTALARAYYTLGGSVLADMDAGDTAYVTFTATGGTKTVDIEAGGYSSFDGHLAF